MAMRKKKEQRHRGAALVEAAIVLPLLLWLVLGAIEYGSLLWMAQQITNAARKGAREYCLPEATTASVGGTINDALASPWDLSSKCDPPVFDPPESVGPGETFTVSITLPVNADVALIYAPGLLPLPPSLTASVTMAKEGP